MKKEIKFRVPIFNANGTFKEWFYWGIFKQDGEWVKIDCPTRHYIVNQRIVEPQDSVQFTGLIDKHGKEIYEGDVVDVEYYNHSMPNTKKKQFVSFLDGCFAMVSSIENNTLESDRNCSPLFWSYRPNTIEVIGNIYENSDLLEK
mgnify:CR=1 FL=1